MSETGRKRLPRGHLHNMEQYGDKAYGALYVIPMHKTGNRRDILKSAIGGVAAAALSPLGARLAFAETETGALTSADLSKNLRQITGAGGNVVVLETGEGLVLVDSGAPEHAEALMSFLDERFGGAPVRALFNTHWHLPHTGANEPIGGTGATILAHENTRLWMSTEYYVEWEKKNYAPRPAAALPTRTFRASDPQPLTYEHGGHRIEYGQLPEAHTDGDIYVYFRDENVLVVGDALGVGAYPVPDYSTGGWIGGLQESTRMLLELTDASTRVVAGEGAAQSRGALQAQSEMLDTLRERIRLGMIAGKSADEIIAENVGEGYEALGDPRRFVSNVYNGLWWGGRLRGAY